MIMWLKVISGMAVCVALLTSVCGAQTTPGCPLAGKTVTLNFDTTPLSAGVELDASAYLNTFGITLSAVTSGSSVLIIGQGFPGIPLATSGPNYFNQFNGNHPETLTMNFCAPLSSISFSRTGMTADSKPAWTAEALNAQGTVLDTVGEPLTATGVPIGPQNFTLSGSGIAALRINSDNGAFTNLSGVPIDDLTLVGGCQVPVTRWSQCQGAPGHWGGDQYAAHVKHDCGRSKNLPCTMCSLGCATTALGIELNASGAFVLPGPLGGPSFLDPGSLNQFMTLTPGDYDGQNNVEFEKTTLDIGVASRNLGATKFLHFDDSLNGISSVINPIPSTDALTSAVCQGHPVIVKTTPVAGCQPIFGPIGGHYVVVTGEHTDSSGNAHFDIVDPGCAAIKSLDVYNNAFEIRGFIPDPADVSTLLLSIDDNATLLVGDNAGSQTGFDPITKQIRKEIVRSAYAEDFLTDNDTGSPATGVTHTVNLFQPAADRYTVTVTGLKLGTYVLDVNPYSLDGTPQSSSSLLGIADLRSTASFQVRFSPIPGSDPEITRLANHQSTLEDITNALQLGLIDNPGVANSLSQKIQNSANATGGARISILNAFISEVNAQSAKHINGVAIQVLLEDANSLIQQVTP